MKNAYKELGSARALFFIFLFNLLLAMPITACKAEDSMSSNLPDMSFMASGKSNVIREGLNEVLPLGTDRAFVEKMLVDVAGAEKKQVFDEVKIYDGYVSFDFDIDKYKETATYSYKTPFVHRFKHMFLTDGKHTISVPYDKNNQVIGVVSISGPTGL